MFVLSTVGWVTGLVVSIDGSVDLRILALDRSRRPRHIAGLVVFAVGFVGAFVVVEGARTGLALD